MKLDRFWKFNGFRNRYGVLLMLTTCLLCQNLSLCFSLNDEGLALLKLKDRVVDDPFGALSNWNNDDGEDNPCSWFGIECSEGKVVALNLKNLCLTGTLAPELGNLVHLQSIIMPNNSFSGTIPDEIGELRELEVLDLAYNNLSGPIPSSLGSNLSITVLILDNNEILGSLSPDIYKMKMVSKVQVDANRLFNLVERSSSNTRFFPRIKTRSEDELRRILSQEESLKTKKAAAAPPPPPTSELPSPPKSPSPPGSPSPPLSPLSAPSPTQHANSTQSVPPSSPSLNTPPPPPPNMNVPPPPQTEPPVPPPPFPPSTQNMPPPPPPPVPTDSNPPSEKKKSIVLIVVPVIGGSFLILLISALAIFFYRRSKEETTVKPLATGISNQLQKVFIDGVANLKRSDLETACEDFSNVIGNSSLGTIYKGTLSSGEEIAAVASVPVSSSEWPMNLEEQFKKKIGALSTVNHKNFVNLIGFCKEEEPFTRMMVFEYAPNGTLFEHLHVEDAEHLNWKMRLRITMGMAYCLEHMHQLTPIMIHRNLNSSVVNLSDDYAAKISDFSFWNNLEPSEPELRSTSTEGNVYSFGIILLEIVTGRVPLSVETGSLESWASDYFIGETPLTELVDPTLESFNEEQFEVLDEVIKDCLCSDPKQRPTMNDITARLRDITGVGPGDAAPRLSPLWWAELEILSAEAS